MALKLVLHFIPLLWLTNSSAAASLAKPGCPDKCANISITYPFGIGPGCSRDKWFEITCNHSFNPPKPFLKTGNLEVLRISPEGYMGVSSPVITNCNNSVDMVTTSVTLGGSPFFFSATKNIFMAMGCDTSASITGPGNITVGCVSICPSSYDSKTCQIHFPSSLQIFSMNITRAGIPAAIAGCKHAFLAEDNRRLEFEYDRQNVSSFPAVLDWKITEGACDCSGNAICVNQSTGYICSCEKGYEGNPYLPQGCQDVDECADPKGSHCKMSGLQCRNTPGSYTCIDESQSLVKSRSLAVALGVGLGVGLLFLLLVSLWSYQALKKRRNNKTKVKFFKRNGGLLLQQEVSSEEGNVERIKIFTVEELEKATDHFNENRILGQGGQGTVYKGMLVNGRIVAVKRSKIVNEGQIEQFINEVVILSHINHRNVVKLLGCCLETEVPLLVYEFVSNGTLFHHIHDQSEEFLSSWDNRLRIAAEVAGALAYLHSTASIPIYHRDIKSTNILLDSKYTAKVSDFGISRSVPIDKTHLTTLVQGTFGYLDPEYFQSSQFTEKSDVYSFGVVIVELLTGEKPISSVKSKEKINLATHFLSSIRENCLFEILDAQVVKEDRKEELEIVANLAKRCLNLNGRKRPTMKEVAMDLEQLRMSQGKSPIQHYSKEECFITGTSEVRDSGSISTESPSSENNELLSLDVNALLFNESTSFMVHTI